MPSIWKCMVFIALWESGVAAQPRSDFPGGVLTLEDALALARQANPELRASAQELMAREAEVAQAKSLPNPELGVEAENLAARGRYRSDENLEFTTRISQALEPGTWGSRIRLATAEKEIARLELESKRLDVLAEVGKAFVEALAAQERRDLIRDLLAMAEEARRAAEERLQAGKSPPLDALRSQAALSLARVERDQAEAEARVALKELAQACGVASLDSVHVEGSLEWMSPVPDWRAIETRITENPDMARWASERKRQEAAWELEKGARLPPLTLGAGFRQSPDREGHALTAEISLPLPAWNWNRGAIRAARHRQQRTLAEQEAASLDLSSRLFAAHSRLAASHRGMSHFQEDILPAAEGAYAAADAGYRAGKLGSLEVLEARRTLSETRDRYLEVRTAYHLSALELQRLLGAPPLSHFSKPAQPLQGDRP